ncbi:MAG TPA: protease pro-enzyme activation domain-containing protein, partial [Myxococcota bacterium]|nr:protease pro-enzyme activation domain-containing protein [Myxococcota bacterium]
MKKITTAFISILTTLPLISQVAFAQSFLKPHIVNHGDYKIESSASQVPLRPLYGHVPFDVGNAREVAPVEGHKILNLSIVLELNNEEELDRFLIDAVSPHNGAYQKFLSQEEFIEKYAPRIEHVESVIQHLTDRGIRPESVEPNRLIVKASGTVEQINRAFHTQITYYEDRYGKQFYAPAYELQVDAALPILSVHGLENRIKARSYLKARGETLAFNPIADSQSQGLTPSGIRQAYSLPSNLNGTGQVLALFELDGFTASDITGYENAFGLPNVPIDIVLIDGFNGQPGDGAVEVTLDIQLMIALAPGVSKIIVYEGPNGGSGLIDTYNKIATDNLASSISTSWGLSESESAGSIIQSENQIFKQMVAQGQVLYAASGDSGAYDNGSTLSVDDPASQPFVVGVGGTHLNVDAHGNYVSETTWSYGSGPGEGGGGGISSIWSIPSWQKEVANSSNLGSTTMRNVPDVSLDADPETGYLIYYGGQWGLVGGTSCAAPLWAAFTALVNQQRASNGAASLGFPNPLLYQAAASSSYDSLFHDIVVGTNGYYPAVVGYDLATGLGSYIASQLISYLAGVASPVCTRANPSISITPSTQSGSIGQTLSYTANISNNDTSACGSSTFDLTTVLPAGFSVNVNPTSLSISPGQTGTATLQVTSSS